MDLKTYFVLLVVVFTEMKLIKAFIQPCYMAAPCTQFERIEVIQCVKEPTCRCGELILPPKSIELPNGLGFGPSALPAVAEAYNQKFFVNGGPFYDFCDAYIPVSSPCSCVKLATPIPSEISSLVYPVVL